MSKFNLANPYKSVYVLGIASSPEYHEVISILSDFPDLTVNGTIRSKDNQQFLSDPDCRRSFNKEILHYNPDLIVTAGLDKVNHKRVSEVLQSTGFYEVVTSEFFLAYLRGSRFKRPTAVIRKSDYGIFQVAEYEEAIASMEYHNDDVYQAYLSGHYGEEATAGLSEDIIKAPLTYIELPTDIAFRELDVANRPERNYVSLANWVKVHMTRIVNSDAVVVTAGGKIESPNKGVSTHHLEMHLTDSMKFNLEIEAENVEIQGHNIIADGITIKPDRGVLQITKPFQVRV